MPEFQITKYQSSTEVGYNVDVENGSEKIIVIYDPQKYANSGQKEEIAKYNYETNVLKLKMKFEDGKSFLDITTGSLPIPSTPGGDPPPHTHFRIRRINSTAFKMGLTGTYLPNGQEIVQFGIGTDDIRIGLVATNGINTFTMHSPAGLKLHYKDSAFHFYYHPY